MYGTTIPGELEVFIRPEDAEHFVEEVLGDDLARDFGEGHEQST